MIAIVPPATEGTWPYAMPGDADEDRFRRTDGRWKLRGTDPRAYMAPIRYVTQCAGCHVKDLQFDKRFDEAAPHDKPDVVQAFLIRNTATTLRLTRSAVGAAAGQTGSCTDDAAVAAAVRTRARNGCNWQVMLADRLLFDKGCKLCHVMIKGNGRCPCGGEVGDPGALAAACRLRSRRPSHVDLHCLP